jgi:hypothetical protein
VNARGHAPLERYRSTAQAAPHRRTATHAITSAGVLRGGGRLERSSAATTVRARDGKTEVLDGPLRAPVSAPAGTPR